MNCGMESSVVGSEDPLLYVSLLLNKRTRNESS